MFTLRNEGLVPNPASHPAPVYKSVPTSELCVLCARRLPRLSRGVKNHPQPRSGPSRPLASSAPARATTPKSLLPPALSLCKIRHLLTHSESTLPQPLIPLDFNSFRP